MRPLEKYVLDYARILSQCYEAIYGDCRFKYEYNLLKPRKKNSRKYTEKRRKTIQEKRKLY